MHFAFTEEQRQIQDAVRGMLTKECTPEVVRAGATGVWSQLAELGVLGMNISEDHGGMGLGGCDWVLLCEEAGRAALPLALTETLALGPILADAGSVELAEAVAEGRARVTVGRHFFVDADEAQTIFRLDGDTLSLMSDPTCVAAESVNDSRRIFTVTGPSRALDVDGAGVLNRLLVGTAAELLGLAEKQLDLAVAYAKERRQFGKPIGAFQAIQHHLANALLALRFAKPVVYRAAFFLSSGDPDLSIHAAMAKSKAADAAYAVRRLALQVHGAIGYAHEYDLHLWMKRSMALEAAWGGAGAQRARIATALNLPLETTHA